MQNKEKLEKPEMEQVMFEAEDVIVTSSCAPNCSSVCESQCKTVL